MAFMPLGDRMVRLDVQLTEVVNTGVCLSCAGSMDIIVLIGHDYCLVNRPCHWLYCWHLLCKRVVQLELVTHHVLAVSLARVCNWCNNDCKWSTVSYREWSTVLHRERSEDCKWSTVLHHERSDDCKWSTDLYRERSEGCKWSSGLHHDYDFLIRGYYTQLWLLILMLLMLYDFSIRGYYTRFWLLLLLLMLMLLLMMLMMLLLVLMLIVVDVDVDVVVVVFC